MPSGNELASIGKNLIIPEKLDFNGIINRDLKRGLKIVDLIPVSFNISYATLFRPSGSGNDSGIREPLVRYSFDKEVPEYQKITDEYGLTPKSGIRLYINDETTSQESFTNTFAPNPIASSLNGIKKPLQAVQSLGSEEAINNLIKSGGETATKYAGVLAGLIGSMFGHGDEAKGLAENLGSLAINLLQGKNISLPDIWDKSNYDATFSLSVKLISPYGTPKSIANFIIKPLMYLLLLSSPRTDDGLTSWKPPYVYINAYGITNMPLAYIEGITIRRGGHDSAYNLFKQPLSIDVQISFKPALPGFAVIDGKKLKPLEALKFNHATESMISELPHNITGMMNLEFIINSLRPMKEGTDDSLNRSLKDIKDKRILNEQVQILKNEISKNPILNPPSVWEPGTKPIVTSTDNPTPGAEGLKFPSESYNLPNSINPITGSSNVSDVMERIITEDGTYLSIPSQITQLKLPKLMN